MVPTLFRIGLDTTLPPVGASYQITVCPEGTVAVAVSVGVGVGGHDVAVWLPPLVGAAIAVLLTAILNVAVAVWQVPDVAKTVTLPLLLPAG